MAINNSKKENEGYISNLYPDGRNPAKEGKGNPREWYELDLEVLSLVAGGADRNDHPEIDTYRYWRDHNGVIREVR